MDLWNMAAPQILTYFLIVVRLNSLFLIAPFWASGTFSTQVKLSLGLILALAIFPTLKPLASLPEHPISLVIIMAQEILVGLIIGYSCNIVFYGIQMGGSLIGHQMMFQMVNVLDPESDMEITIIGQIEFLVAILIFLVIDGHHWLLKAMVDSFELIPLGKVQLNIGQLLRESDHLFGRLFIIALQVAAPAGGTLFLAHFTMGLIARVMPQMNVFIVGMPLYVGLGFIVTGISLGSSYIIFERYFLSMADEIYILLRLMR